MLIETNRVAAVICPECSNAVISSISAFSLSGGQSVSVKCPTKGCENTCFTISQKNKKVSIKIQCAFCGDIHTFTTDTQKLLSKDLITFPCPEINISSFFLGTQSNVAKALEESLFTIEKIYDETMDDIVSLNDCEYDEDDDIFYDILDELHMLRDKDALSCVCGCETLTISEAGGKILISCPRCRRSKLLAVNEGTLAMILNATAIILGK